MNKQVENDNFDLKSFDLGELGGGKQIIFAHKFINEKEHYVVTLGQGPKNQSNAVSAEPTDEQSQAKNKNMLSNFRNKFGVHKNTNEQVTSDNTTASNIKLRCFKLLETENKKYTVQEFTTPQGIDYVAKMIGMVSEEPEITK